MGWPWSRKPSADGQTPASISSSPSTAPLPTSPPSPPSSTTPPSTTQDQIESDDDRELRKFMALWREDSSGSSGVSASAPSSGPSASAAPAPSKRFWSWSSSPESDATETQTPTQQQPPTRERSLGEAVLPTSMSCQQAFDLAWGCQSPVGQWRAVYRHGTVRPCSDLWDDFWFCMRVKSFSATAREEAVRAHYRDREMTRYYDPGTRSSEDVWRSRTVDEVLPAGAVFQRSFQQVLQADAASPAATPPPASAVVEAVSSTASPEELDADRIRKDLDRRRHIRKQMGYDS